MSAPLPLVLEALAEPSARLAAKLGLIELSDPPTSPTRVPAEPLVRLRLLRAIPPNNSQEIVFEPQSRSEQYVSNGWAELAPEGAP